VKLRFPQLAVTFKYLLIYIYNKELYLNILFIAGLHLIIYNTLILLQSDPRPPAFVIKGVTDGK